MKKLTCLTLTILMVLTMSASIASAEGAGLDLANIKILVAGDTPVEQQKVFDEVESRTRDSLNIKLEVMYTPWSEYIEKHKMMAAAGEVFDIYLNFSFDILPAYATRRQAVRLNDLIEEFGQDILKNISPDDMKAGYAGADLIAIPAIYPKDSVYQTGLVRKDLREKYGLPEVTDVDTLGQFLEAIAENEPSMVPIDGNGIMTFISRQIDVAYPDIRKEVLFGTGNARPVYWVEEGDEAYVVKSYYESIYATEQIAYGARGYNNGWWPRDLNAGTVSKDLFIPGKAAFINIDLFHFTQIYNDMKKTVPEAELEWTILAKDAPIKVDMSNNFAQICSTSKDPARAMMFLNWIQASQENYDLWYWGIEGEHYTLDDGGVVQLAEGVSGGGTSGGGDNPYAPTPWYFKNSKWDRAVNTDALLTIEATDYAANHDKWPLPKTNAFVIDPTNISLELTQIDKVVDEQWNALINGQIQGEEAYDSFMQDIKNAGLDTVISETQTQLDQFLADNGIEK